MRKTFYLLFAAVIVLHAGHGRAQGIMTTWIGDSTAGYTGDGGPAAVAEINNPYSVCFDGAGNFYFADQSNYAVRKVAVSTNIITTIAGVGSPGYTGDGGPGSAAMMGYPYGVCTDAAGNIYISDMGNSVVRKVNAATGIITTIAGNGVSGNTGDGSPATSAQMSEPQGICIAGSRLYICDYGSACVRMVNLSTGLISTAAGTGTAGYSGDGGPAVAAMLNGPSSICADNSGNLFIADETNFVIRKVAAGTGVITTIAGTGVEGYSGDDSAAINAKIGFIDGICADNFGNLYIDDLSCSSRKINMSSGIITTMAGSGTLSGYSGDGGAATSELLNWPAGLCVDPTNGTIIIADQLNNRIRRATQPGFFETTGLTQVAGPQVAVYPNPSAGRFNVFVPAAKVNSAFEVFNIGGQRVYAGMLRDNVTAIDLSDVAAGTFVLQIEEPGGSTFTQKLVINK